MSKRTQTDIWLPEHHRKRNALGSYSGFNSGPNGTHYTAGCECGAIFRGRTFEGRERFLQRHEACQDDACPCCGREMLA